LVALARPQAVVSLPRVEGTVILVFDVSGSMAADDLKPNRMEAAKAAAVSFVQRQPASVQVGIVAFSDGGLAVQAPTNDQNAILASINRLAPQRGTSLGQGIIAALKLIAASEEQGSQGQGSSLDGSQPQEAVPEITIGAGAASSSLIVLLTDGENNAPPDPFEAAQLAADLGVRVYTVGIGSSAGTVLNINGFTVHTRLDEALLQHISQVTDGVYFNAGSEQGLQSIYENISPELVIKPEKMEVTPIFAGASIFMLLIGGVFSLLWFGRLP
jgi:Ca-activated chloride channel family protein